jgi:hypothetical protein
VPPQSAYHPFYSHLFSHLTIEDAQGEAIAESIRRQNLLVCSDGSFDPITRKAAYGLIIADHSAKVHHLKLHGPCVGHVNTRSAIRAELCSLSAATYLLLNLIERFGLHNGSLTLYNDCSKALKYVNYPGRKFKRFLTDDYDLLCEIRSSIKGIKMRNVTFNLLWVKGHFTG